MSKQRLVPTYEARNVMVELTRANTSDASGKASPPPRRRAPKPTTQKRLD